MGRRSRVRKSFSKGGYGGKIYAAEIFEFEGTAVAQMAED
jgi:hypothetical protein